MTTNSTSDLAHLETIDIYGKVTCHYVPMKYVLVQLYKTSPVAVFVDLIDETLTENNGIFYVHGKPGKIVDNEKFYIVVRHQCEPVKNGKKCIHWDHFLVSPSTEKQVEIEVSKASVDRITDCDPPKKSKKNPHHHVKPNDLILLKKFLESKLYERFIRAQFLRKLSQKS
uniref:Uncharacterized protein n=1 Tax=Syphacia muris TaxID=451379 RepID=A0A0N5AV86_9BILA